MQDIKDILKEYWGFENFRPLQENIIRGILDGNDILAVLPTGGGKSICFQVPAMVKEGICLVVSPLIALMKDQVHNLRKKGIPSLTLHSGLNYIEVNKVLQNATYGNYKFLYVSPERLESALFLEYLPGINVNLIAVDEAHCVSQWGYDFRPPYLRIAALRNYFPEVPIIALTASATKEVRVDIVQKLEFRKNHQTIRQSFARPNLSYSVFNLHSKENKLLEILEKVKGSGIVYCKSRRKTKEIADLLKMKGISAEHYHAGLSTDERNITQQAWVDNKFRIISCTNAFGMGIDKGDVSIVVHFDIPECLENYYQEAGRAGRDGNKAYAVLLYREKEARELQDQVTLRFPDRETVTGVYKALVNYLQLPSESGENLYFDFDLNDFCQKFKLNNYTAVYSLKVLQQEEYIAYTDEVFKPAKVVFTTSKSELEIFEDSYPDFEPLIKSLLRSYNGIFDFPASINKKQLATSLKITEGQIDDTLTILDKSGLIEYVPQTQKPQVQFLKNRVRSNDLWLNESEILKRKTAFQDRVNGIINFINDKVTCRSKLIAKYFDDENLTDCGVCDNCINRKEDSKSMEPEQLLQLVSKKNGGISVENLLIETNDSKEHIWKLLDFLIGEQRISIDTNGSIRAKKKGPR